MAAGAARKKFRSENFKREGVLTNPPHSSPFPGNPRTHRVTLEAQDKASVSGNIRERRKAGESTVPLPLYPEGICVRNSAQALFVFMPVRNASEVFPWHLRPAPPRASTSF